MNIIFFFIFRLLWSSQPRRSISNALKKKEKKEKEILDDRVNGQLSHYEARMSRGKENIIFIFWLSASARANSRIDDLKQQQRRKKLANLTEGRLPRRRF